MKKINTMLHMKLNAAVSVFSIAAAFSVFLPPSFTSSALAAQPLLQIPPEQRGLLSIELPTDASAARLAGICFLPDCNLDGTSFDDVNSDSSWCIDNCYNFNCPEGTAPDYSQACPRDESYTKCSSEQWCIDNGYTKTAQSCYDLGPTWFPQDLCPKGFDLYKSCIEDTAQACEDKGYLNNCSRPDKTEICEWNSSFAKCCNDTESNGCPENSKVSGCEDGTIVGQDTCGYDCHQCCQTSCPAGYAYTDEETSGGTSGYIKDGDDYCLHCTRGKLYKRKENPCTGYDLCSTYGGVDNGDYCYTGNTKKYSECLTECRPGYIEWCDTPVTDCEKLGYTQTAAECANVPAVACPFNGDKWYCKDYSNIRTSGYCCGYTTECGYNGGTSNSYDNNCQYFYKMSCYDKCKSFGYPDCFDLHANCRASGGTSVYQYCTYGDYGGAVIVGADYTCE